MLNLKPYPHFFLLGALAIALFSISAALYTYLRGPGVGVEGGILDPAPAYAINRLLFPLTVNSTSGPMEVPVKGKINVFVPQYVRCPDICHMETIVMLYVMKTLMDKGLVDDVVWITVDVDPWSSTLEDARSYMKAKAGGAGLNILVDRGFWVWVLDSEDKLRKIWSQLDIRVERTRTGLVAHTAGFVIVDGDGYIRYYVNPRDWANLTAIADKIVELVENIKSGR
jgi:protein SCO1/2